MYKRIETHGVSIFLISLLLIRILIMGASIGDAIAFLGLAGFTAYSLYSSRKHDDDVIKQLELYSNSMNSLKEEMDAHKKHLEDIERLKLELMDVRQQMAYGKMNKARDNSSTSTLIKNNTQVNLENKEANGTKRRLF